VEGVATGLRDAICNHAKRVHRVAKLLCRRSGNCVLEARAAGAGHDVLVERRRLGCRFIGLRAHDGLDAAGVMQSAFQLAAIFQHDVPKRALDPLASY
jgi:hypothetical protein